MGRITPSRATDVISASTICSASGPPSSAVTAPTRAPPASMIRKRSRLTSSRAPSATASASQPAHRWSLSQSMAATLSNGSQRTRRSGVPTRHPTRGVAAVLLVQGEAASRRWRRAARRSSRRGAARPRRPGPARSISAWVKPGGISSTWWETRIVAGEYSSSASTDSVATRSSRPPRSSPAAGSSRMSSSGSVISARAIWTRLRSPSLRVPKVRSSRAPAPTSRSSAVARSWSSSSYRSRQRPTTPYDAETTTSRTISCRGIRSATAALVQPMRGRSSKTSTVPTTSPRIPTTPEVGWICAEHSCISVVLPAPLGPRITQRSSSSTVQSTPSSRVAPPRLTVTSASSSTAFTNGTSAARSGSGGVVRQPTRP